MPTPLPFGLRALTAVATFAIKRGWLPTPVSLLDKPHDERLARKAMGIACKPGDRSIRTQDVMVGGRGGPIPTRVYSRPDLQAGAPAILFIHGGGFVDGGVDFCDNVQRGLAARTGYVVVGLSYRLAPEHPFPAALEDCQDVLRWMAESKPAGLDPTRIAVGGESAGGNLTVALALSSRDSNGPAIASPADRGSLSATSRTDGAGCSSMRTSPLMACGNAPRAAAPARRMPRDQL
jgi:acetyl esterase